MTHTNHGDFRCWTRDVIKRSLYAWVIWEPAITRYPIASLRPADTFVDVGANIGYISVLAARLGSNVIAFEPSPSIYRMLTENMAANHVAARLVMQALSNKSGALSLSRGPETNIGMTSLVPADGADLEAVVPAVTLCDALEPSEAATLRLLKIDVEGHANEVIDGLYSLLPSTRADFEIILELDGSATGDEGLRRRDALLLTDLASCGFHAYAIDNSYDPRPYAERSHRCSAPRLRAGDIATDVLLSRRDEAEICW
jgi:FkbM family methyltransferase